MLPGWVQTISKVSPNAWGTEGFLRLSRGGSINSVLTPVIALLIMGAVLFAAAAFWLSKRGLARK
jgi:ABC-2 type transport system permease protein